jgi:hypothetical protein
MFDIILFSPEKKFGDQFRDGDFGFLMSAWGILFPLFPGFENFCHRVGVGGFAFGRVVFSWQIIFLFLPPVEGDISLGELAILGKLDS